MTDEKKARKKGGRPLSTDEPRSHVLRIRFSPKEFSRLENEAHAAGVSVTEVVRSRALAGRVLRARALIPQMNSEAYSQLARSAANLNQLTHHLNEKKRFMNDQVAAELGRLLTQLSEEIKSLRLALIGSKTDSES